MASCPACDATMDMGQTKARCPECGLRAWFGGPRVAPGFGPWRWAVAAIALPIAHAAWLGGWAAADGFDWQGVEGPDWEFHWPLVGLQWFVAVALLAVYGAAAPYPRPRRWRIASWTLGPTVVLGGLAGLFILSAVNTMCILVC